MLAKGSYAGNPASGAGLPYKRVQVMEIVTDGTARCLDDFGNEHKINVGQCRTKALLPQAGETWLIDCIYDGWVFGMLLSGFTIPTVTGSLAASDPLARSILAALVSLGLVQDGSSA